MLIIKTIIKREQIIVIRKFENILLNSNLTDKSVIYLLYSRNTLKQETAKYAVRTRYLKSALIQTPPSSWDM